MGSVPNFNYDEPTVSFTGLRGDVDIDPPALVNHDETIGVIDREHLGDFITGFGLVEDGAAFPRTFSDIKDDVVFVSTPTRNRQVYRVYELVDGDLAGLPADYFDQAIRYCGGTGGFEPEGFRLYVPSGTSGLSPFALVSDYTPTEFAIHRLFGDRASFLEQFGATACPVCETVEDDPFVDCPSCGERPESVAANLETIQATHGGVLVLIAPVQSDSLAEMVERGDVTPIQSGEPPEPEIDVIESPGAD